MTENRAALHKLIADTAADVSVQNQYWTAGDLADALIATGKLVLIGLEARSVLEQLFEAGWDTSREETLSFFDHQKVATDAALAALGGEVMGRIEDDLFHTAQALEAAEARATAAEAREAKLRESLTQLLTDMHEATCNGMSWITYEEVQVMKHRARAAIEENQRGQG